MSAIFGKISFDGKIDSVIAERMKEGYSDCKIDEYSTIVNDKIFMGCAKQFLVEGSEREELPFEDDDYIFTADAIVFDKTDVAQKLGIGETEPDGKVLFEAVKKWKFDFGLHLYGCFTACLYDKKERKLYLFTDHVGYRCIYYRKTDEGFYFSTLIKPILEVAEKKIPLSERWMTYWGINCTPSLLVTPELTPFDGIFQLEPHRCLVIDGNDGTLEKISYWNPLEHIKRYKVSDEEGLKLFRENIENCIKGMLRPAGKMGVELSSGLDSSTVACLAIRELTKKGEKLYSFTSVPLEGFDEKIDKGRIADETSGVLEIVKEYPDIVPTFLSCSGLDALKIADSVIDILEVPYKATINMSWVNELYKDAAQKGCTLLLTGQSGNGTISYGYITNSAYRLFAEGHYLKAIKIVNTFSRHWHFSRKKMLKILLKTYINVRILNEDFTIGRLSRSDLMKKYAAKQTYKKNLGIMGSMDMDSFKEQMAFMWSDTVLNNLAIYETKLGLRYGIHTLDVTRHPKNMLLIAGLPITCTAGGIFERRLVREGMEGVVPESIRMNVLKRGLQGADYLMRLENTDSKTKDVASARINDKALDRFIDDKVLNSMRETFNKYGINRKGNEVLDYYIDRVLLAFVLSSFVEKFER